MEGKKFHVASLLLLVIILASQEMLCRGQTLLCERKSQEYRGFFCRSATCRSACQSEGFKKGYCHFRWLFPLNRKCMCQQPCTAAPGPEEDASDLPLDYSTNLRTTDLGR